MCNNKDKLGISKKVLIDKITNLDFITSVFIALVFIMIITFTLFFIYYGYSGGGFDHPFCLREECIDYFRKIYRMPLGYLIYFSKFIASVVSVFAIFVALYTYSESVKSNHLSTHLAHYKNFQEYTFYLMESLPTITKEFVDVYFLYNYIFPKSKEGKYQASDPYITFVQDLNNIIDTYGDQRSGETDVIQPFNEHQKKLRELLNKLNIYLPLKPNQSDFHKVEFDLYELLKKINQAFLGSEFVKIKEARYS